VLSVPRKNIDRTKYLFSEINPDGEIAIAEIIAFLIASSSRVIGNSCNTARTKPLNYRCHHNIE
tara:strand:- start:102 stop:293 length:192 start_codon:yes stop_codon:yes gene_type:complete